MHRSGLSVARDLLHCRLRYPTRMESPERSAPGSSLATAAATPLPIRRRFDHNVRGHRARHGALPRARTSFTTPASGGAKVALPGVLSMNSPFLTLAGRGVEVDGLVWNETNGPAISFRGRSSNSLRRLIYDVAEAVRQRTADRSLRGRFRRPRSRSSLAGGSSVTEDDFAGPPATWIEVTTRRNGRRATRRGSSTAGLSRLLVGA